MRRIRTVALAGLIDEVAQTKRWTAQRSDRETPAMRRVCGLLAAGALVVACAAHRPARELVPAVPDAVAAAEREAAAINSAVPIDAFAPDTFTDRGITLPYRLLSPGVQAPGERYPLVLVLHGSGAIGADNRSQMGALARSWALPGLRQQFPAFVVVPQFPDRSAVYATDARDALPSSEGTAALDAALALVAQVMAARPVDPRRVYVVGFSMGASTAWHAMLRRPGLFAAAVAIAAIPPPRATAPGLASTPIFMVHGNADTENPIAADQAMFAALLRAGARAIRFLEHEGLDHRPPPGFVSDPEWRAWLFAQRSRDGV